MKCAASDDVRRRGCAVRLILDRCGGVLTCGTDCSEHSHHDRFGLRRSREY